MGAKVVSTSFYNEKISEAISNGRMPTLLTGVCVTAGLKQAAKGVAKETVQTGVKVGVKEGAQVAAKVGAKLDPLRRSWCLSLRSWCLNWISMDAGRQWH